MGIGERETLFLKCSSTKYLKRCRLLRLKAMFSLKQQIQT
jgi:hypothetical protein